MLGLGAVLAHLSLVVPWSWHLVCASLLVLQDVYAARKHDLRGFDELCPIYRVGKQLCKTEDACPCG